MKLSMGSNPVSLVHVVENPIGCYDETRFTTREAMIRSILSVFDPPPFPAP